MWVCPLPFVLLSPTEERRAREWPLETAELPEGHLEDWLEKRAKRLSSAPSIRCRPQGYPSSFLMEVSRANLTMNPHYRPSWRWGPHWEVLGSQTPARGSCIGELPGPLALLIAHPIRLKERLVAKCGSTPGMAKGQGLPVTAKLPMSLGLTVPCRALYKGKLKLTETLEEAEQGDDNRVVVPLHP